MQQTIPTARSRLPARHFHLVFSLLMGLVMVTLMSFFITWMNLGFGPEFFSKWGRVFVLAYLLAVPIIYFLAPVVRRLVSRFVELPKP